MKKRTYEEPMATVDFVENVEDTILVSIVNGLLHSDSKDWSTRNEGSSSWWDDILGGL